jgi:aspartate carbamoyltransferase catalytic subunit
VRVSYDLTDAIEDADAVIVLPLQPERYRSGMMTSLREYRSLFALTSERLKLANSEVLVLPAEPMSNGVEIAPDVSAALAPFMQQQATNSIAVRMALLYLLAGG